TSRWCAPCACSTKAAWPHRCAMCTPPVSRRRAAVIHQARATMGLMRSWSELEAAGLAGGLDVVAATSAAPFLDAERVLLERRSAGLAGSMQFTYRNPARSTDPERTLPGVRTLIAGATSYHRDPPPKPHGPTARVARYVWADDQAR